jgi:hypothetical protein
MKREFFPEFFVPGVCCCKNQIVKLVACGASLVSLNSNVFPFDVKVRSDTLLRGYFQLLSTKRETFRPRDTVPKRNFAHMNRKMTVLNDGCP